MQTATNGGQRPRLAPLLPSIFIIVISEHTLKEERRTERGARARGYMCLTRSHCDFYS